jgi:eukaryotic-like serine/threonine-protein kinase
MIGKRVLHFDILDKLGEGGMGVVYKARDTHLDRLVAIKVLPAEKVADAERRHRFVQEARAASALNHPNIIHIYDIDQAEGIDFIAMEYVAGKTLEQVIPRHGMRVNEALTCAVQMADALAKAHAAGIVHRDLKPGNVMVTDEGQVKVLDFGLAKLTEAGPLGDDEPTHTVKPATEEGTIVGTVAYMSPEQAEGKKVDARSDIFSFGAVLYEMLTGRRAFQEESKTSTLGAIIHKEPEPLGAEVPQELSRLITRCLRKDPERRFQHMKDLRVELEELKEDSDSGKLTRIPPAARKRPWRWLWAAAAAAAVLLAAALVWQLRQVSPPSDLTPVALTTYSGIETQPSFSPDGSKVAFVWNGDREDNRDIYVKQIGSAGPPLRLTADPAADLCPAWSPDDRWIAFMRWQQDGLAIMLIPPLGGPERTLTKIRGFQEQGWSDSDTLSWTPDGKWLGFAERDAGEQMSIWAMSVDSGERRRLTTFQTTGRAGEGRALGDMLPAFSPDGLHLAIARQERNLVFGLYVQTLTRDLRPAGEPVSVTGHRYANVSGLTWTADGHELVYAAGSGYASSLWRVPVSGAQTPRRLAYALSAATSPAVARTPPRLVYAWTIRNTRFWRLDTRTGERKALFGSTGFSAFPQYSPDGRKIAFTSERSGNREVWTCDGDGTNCQQLTFFDGPMCGTPRWSPDGRWLALDSYGEG